MATSSGAHTSATNKNNDMSASTERRSESNCSTDKLIEAMVQGSIVGGAAGLVAHLRATSGVIRWKAFPYSIVRGALAFGCGLGIYEGTKCKLMQTEVLDDLSSSTIAGGLGTGLGGLLFGVFPWTMPNSTRAHAEEFQKFRKEIPRNFVKCAAIGAAYFSLESIVLSKFSRDKKD